MLDLIWKFLGNNAAEIIALCALFYTAFQAHTTRKHNRLSVTPYLTTFTHTLKTPQLVTLVNELMNNGLGPAVIKEYKIFLDGSQLDIKNSDQAEKELEILLQGKEFNRMATVLNKGYYVPPGEKRIVLSISFPVNEKQKIEDFLATLERLSLSIEYESTYGQKFTYDSNKKS
jgi:hypothetical protein